MSVAILSAETKNGVSWRLLCNADQRRLILLSPIWKRYCGLCKMRWFIQGARRDPSSSF